MPEQPMHPRERPEENELAQNGHRVDPTIPTDGSRRAEAQRSRVWFLRSVRYVLPVIVVIAGAVVMSFGGESELEGGAGIVSAGLAIYFLNWIVRLGVSGDRERDREEAAREYYAKHGRWPS